MSESSDHDALITLINEVKNLNQKVENGLKNVEKKIDDTFSGVKAQVLEHEGRLKAIEKIQQVTAPEKAAKDLEDLIEWKKQFTLTWKFVILASSLVGAIVGFILSVIVDLQHLIH